MSEVWSGQEDPGDVGGRQSPRPGVGGVELPEEDQLGVHLLVPGPQPHLVQGAQGRLLHLDIQLPQARRGQGSQVKDPQGPQRTLSQAEQELNIEGYIQVKKEICDAPGKRISKILISSSRKMVKYFLEQI